MKRTQMAFTPKSLWEAPEQSCRIASDHTSAARKDRRARSVIRNSDRHWYLVRKFVVWSSLPTLCSSDPLGQTLPLLEPGHVWTAIWPTWDFVHRATPLNCPTRTELPTGGRQLETAIANEGTLQKRKKPYRKRRISVRTHRGMAVGRIKVKFGYNTLTYTLMTEEGQPWDPCAGVCFVLWFCISPTAPSTPHWRRFLGTCSATTQSPFFHPQPYCSKMKGKSTSAKYFDSGMRKILCFAWERNGLLLFSSAAQHT